MILIPKYTDMYNKEPICFEMGLGGEFRCILRDLMGRPVYDTGWDGNLILDVGLDTIGTLNPASYFNIGDDNTPAVVGQTGLLSRLATTNDSAPSIPSAGNNGVGDNYSKHATAGARFDAGEGTGTIRELSVSNGSNDANCFARHVLAVPISKAADQVLDVWWKHTVYPPLGDVDTPAGITLDGEAFTTKVRGSTIDEATQIGALKGMAFDIDDAKYYGVNGTIGTNLGSPTGSSLGHGSALFTISNVGYTPGNHYRDATWYQGLDLANLGQDIRCTTVRFTNFKIQTMFTSDVDSGGIDKDNTKTLSLTYRQSWVRH